MQAVSNHSSNFYNIYFTHHRSGSREAQALLFRHSVDGDLTRYATFSVRPEAAVVVVCACIDYFVCFLPSDLAEYTLSNLYVYYYL